MENLKLLLFYTVPKFKEREKKKKRKYTVQMSPILQKIKTKKKLSPYPMKKVKNNERIS